MRGAVNAGLEVRETSEDGKVADIFELSNQHSKDVLVKCPSNYPPAENGAGGDKENGLLRPFLKMRSLLEKWLFGGNSASRLFWTGAVNVGAVVLLAATVRHYIDKGSPPIDWCEGVGFLWIIYACIYGGLLFSLAKKYLNKRPGPGFEVSKTILGKWTVVTGNTYFRVFCVAFPTVLLGVAVFLYPGKSGRRKYSFLGIVVFTIIGFLFSKHPGKIKWRPVVCGIFLQFAFGFLVINWTGGKRALDCLGGKVTKFLSYSEEGSKFVYNQLAVADEVHGPIFAFSVLPIIFFVSFFINILSYYGALQWFIMKVGWAVKLVLGTTACESVNAAASIFLGMTESPLLIKHYLKDFSKSELCAIMCAGLSTVSGSVMAAYVKFGVKASHLIAASVMSAPASLSLSKLLYPEVEHSKTNVDNLVLQREQAANVLDAASKGAHDAIAIVLNIVANIIAVLSFLAFLDGIFSWIGYVVGFDELSFQYIMSKIFIPVSYLIGVDPESVESVSYLVGIKVVANEFQAYVKLAEMIKANTLSERSETLATYALCGFSNFGSISITTAALAAIEPNQRSNLAEVALYSFVAANIVCFMTACVAGCFID